MIKLFEASLKFDTRGIAGLHGIDLSIPKGQIFSIMGPNGSGKTTLLKVIKNELKLDSGKMEINGSIHEFEWQELPPHENVQKYLISKIKLEMDEEKKVQLTRDFADLFEFTFQLKQNCKELSQGQRQKVMLTAELINNPDILLLDEPFVHLDPMSRKEILDALFRFIRQRQSTVVWVTHERDEAMRFGDKMGVMRHGKFEQVAQTQDYLMYPRNLFVAQFMGQKNFIHIKRKDGKWETPWGHLPLEFPHEEAYLVIPPRAWTIEINSPFQARIKSKTPQPFFWEIEVEWNEKRFIVELEKNEKIGTESLPLNLNLSDCFLISL